MLSQFQITYKKIGSYFRHLSQTHKRCILVCVVVILLIWLINTYYGVPRGSNLSESTLTEGFVSGRPQTVIRTGPEQIYDKFYF